MRKIPNITRVNVTMGAEHAKLLKEFGGSAFIRAAIDIEKAKRLWLKAVEVCFEDLQLHGRDKNQQTIVCQVPFDAFGESYIASYRCGNGAQFLADQVTFEKA